MHVAHFIQRYPPALGGSEAYFARLGQYLEERGDRVTVWTTTAIELEELWKKPLSPRTAVRGLRDPSLYSDALSRAAVSAQSAFARSDSAVAMHDDALQSDLPGDVGATPAATTDPSTRSMPRRSPMRSRSCVGCSWPAAAACRSSSRRSCISAIRPIPATERAGNTCRRNCGGSSARPTAYSCKRRRNTTWLAARLSRARRDPARIGRRFGGMHGRRPRRDENVVGHLRGTGHRPLGQRERREGNH